MKIFLDECVDWRLSRDLADHQVMTARQMGWTSIKNGELPALASREFDVFVTTDRNLSFQQNVDVLPIAVIVLNAPTNRLADLQPLVPVCRICHRGWGCERVVRSPRSKCRPRWPASWRATRSGARRRRHWRCGRASGWAVPLG